MRRVRADLGPRVLDLRLCGSVARGEARPDSDIDILVVVEADNERGQLEREVVDIVTKKLKVPAATARGKVELFAQRQVVLLTVDDVLGAIDVHRLHEISFWDALLVQTARRAGCTTLLTETCRMGGDSTVSLSVIPFARVPTPDPR